MAITDRIDQPHHAFIRTTRILGPHESAKFVCQNSRHVISGGHLNPGEARNLQLFRKLIIFDFSFCSRCFGNELLHMMKTNGRLFPFPIICCQRDIARHHGIRAFSVKRQILNTILLVPFVKMQIVWNNKYRVLIPLLAPAKRISTPTPKRFAILISANSIRLRVAINQCSPFPVFFGVICSNMDKCMNAFPSGMDACEKR